MKTVFLAAALALLGLVAPRPAQAAPSSDGCTGMLAPELVDWNLIIETPGVWCLDHDLVFAGQASPLMMVLIAADDVVVDCRGHWMRNLGTADYAYGIFKDAEASGVTVRNCGFSNFTHAIELSNYLDQAGTFLVEDNVIVGGFIDGEGSAAIVAAGRGAIRRNRIRDAMHNGIIAGGWVEVSDNVIDGLVDSSAGDAAAIVVFGNPGSTVSGNRIRGLRHDPAFPGNGPLRGVLVNSGEALMRDNVLAGDGTTPTLAFSCPLDPEFPEENPPQGRLVDNLVTGFSTLTDHCVDVGDNDIAP